MYSDGVGFPRLTPTPNFAALLQEPFALRPFSSLDVIHSVLIANRGEIALRIVRAVRDLGLRAITVYSEADKLAPHVLLADEAYEIGPPPASESYLCVDRLIEVARVAQADAVHPGYGFLAERADFAQAVESAGIIFIGPMPETIAAMGDKTEARKRMAAAGVPIVPGAIEAVSSASEALRASEELGFPVLLKAVSGGGGKGMRVVERPEELERSFTAATREAEGAFGDGRIYVESYVDRPRHVEVQILGDNYGNLVHLGERECSIQRRHQKLIEEAPSPLLTAQERSVIGEVALTAARAVDYRGAGTVEFLYQGDNYYFLEMNTRLQVEHPVTELITGIDLVEWQLRVASGEPLGFSQGDITLTGHAIECRITAEDPLAGFLPSTGTISHLEVPAGLGVRWDGGVLEGLEVSRHYDPLLGKLITHGSDRLSAVVRMARALDELEVVGVKTSAFFHRRVMEETDFLAGNLSVAYLDEHPDVLSPRASEDDLVIAAAAAALMEDYHRRRHRSPRFNRGNAGNQMSAWRASK